MAAKTIDLAYGKHGLTLELPSAAEITVIQKPAFPSTAPPETIIREALAKPVGSSTLDEIARNKASACILICDITRPVPNHTFLQPIIRKLTSAGIPLEKITILIATGLHRPTLGDELAELIGDSWVLENVRIINHDAMNDEDHIDLGVTQTRGTPIKLDRRFTDADVKIATGLVEPHFMAGYSGGRKVVAPGVAHHETIRTFHSARFMEDPGAIQCNLDQNPLHEEQLEIVRLLGDVFALNTVLDEHRNLVYATFGEIIESHLQAVEFTRTYTEIPVGETFNTVVTSSAGYPLDQTYYQTVKGMVTPLSILNPGGHLIIASECTEGMGSAAFVEAQRRLIDLGPTQFLDTLLAKQFADVDEWQTEMQLKPMRVGTISLYSDKLSAADHALTGVEHIENLSESITQSIEHYKDPRVAIIPEGPYVVPLAAKSV